MAIYELKKLYTLFKRIFYLAEQAKGMGMGAFGDLKQAGMGALGQVKGLGMGVFGQLQQAGMGALGNLQGLGEGMLTQVLK